MTRLGVALACLALLAFVPPVAALAPCGDEAVDAGVGWYARFTGTHVEVWHEENGVPGLQTTSCLAPDGSTAGPDFRNVNAKVPDRNELPCIPLFRPCPL